MAKKLMLAVVVVLGLAGGAIAAKVTCPLHNYASCYNTYELSSSGSAYKWRCTCSDDVWVAK